MNRATEGDRIISTAIVTDPDGIDDLIGGALETPDGRTYGAFSTSAAEGVYGLELQWADVHQVEALDFQVEEDRTFVARFFDQGGNTTSARVTVTLHCDGNRACDGRCAADASEFACACLGRQGDVCYENRVVSCGQGNDRVLLDCSDVLGDGEVAGTCGTFPGTDEAHCIMDEGGHCAFQTGDGTRVTLPCGRDGVFAPDMGCVGTCVEGLPACNPARIVRECEPLGLHLQGSEVRPRAIRPAS